MELARAGFAHNFNNAARSAPVFGVVVGSQNLNFLDRIHILSTHRIAGQLPDSDGNSAINRDHVFIGSCTIDAVASRAEISEALVSVGAYSLALHTRAKLGY